MTKMEVNVPMKKVIVFLLCIAFCSFVFAGGAKEPATADMSNYPSKSITFIVNRGAGGSTDLVARAVANSIQHDKGITTAVVNYEGGDGLIGVAELMNSAPDGYTFCVIGCTEIPNMLANFEEAGFTKEDLFPVCQVSAKSRILVAAPDSPFTTLEELKEYGQAHPGELTCAVAGSNTIYLAELLGDELGFEFTVVNAGSGNDAFTMVLGGHVDVAIIGQNYCHGALAEGLAVLGDSMPQMEPNSDGVPTFLSQGYDFKDTSFNYILAPKGTPEEYIQYISDLVGELFESGSMKENIQKADQDPVFMGYAEFKPYYESYIDQMVEVLKR